MTIRSLVDLSINKLALHLWNLPVALEFVSTTHGESKTYPDLNLWNEITRLVKDRARKYIYDIPLVLKNRLANTLHQISASVYEWFDELLVRNEVLEEPDILRVFITRLHANLVFTGVYDQDKVSTAKSIVADVQIGIKLRFWIATEFCLEEQVFKLWRDMDEKTRMLLNSSFVTKLGNFWIRWAQNKLEDETYHPSSDAFDQMFYPSLNIFAHYRQNEAHCYFWDKVTAGKRHSELRMFFNEFSRPRSRFEFIIQRLNRQQLERIVDNGGCGLLWSLARHRNDDMNDLLEACVAMVPEDTFTYELAVLADLFYSPTLMEIVWNSSTIAQRRRFYEDDYRLKVYKRIARYGDRHVLERILLQATDGDRQLLSGTSEEWAIFRQPQSEQVGCAQCSSNGGKAVLTPYQLCLHQLKNIRKKTEIR